MNRMETKPQERVARALAEEFGYEWVFDADEEYDLGEMYDADYWRHVASKVLTAACNGTGRSPEEDE